MRHTTRATLAILLAAFIWSTGSVTARFIEAFSLNVFIYAAMIMGLALIVSTAYLRYTRTSLRGISRSTHVRLALGGIANVLITYCLTLAFQSAPLGTVIFLMEVAPIYTLILGAIFLKESLSRKKIFSLVLAIIGIALILRPGHASLTAGIVLALAAGVIVAIDYVMVRSTHATNTIAAAWWRSCYGFCAALPLAMLLWEPPVIASVTTFALVVGWSGIVLIGIGNLLYFFALKYLSAGTVSLLRLTDVVWTVMWGVLLFHEIPSILAVLGGLLIVASAANVARTSPH